MHGHPCTGVQQRRRFAMHLTPAIIRLWMGQVRPPDGSIKGTRLSWHLPSSQPWEPTERRQQQFRQLHSFPSTLIERSVLIFACLLSLFSCDQSFWPSTIPNFDNHCSKKLWYQILLPCSKPTETVPWGAKVSHYPVCCTFTAWDLVLG